MRSYCPTLNKRRKWQERKFILNNNILHQLHGHYYYTNKLLYLSAGLILVVYILLRHHIPIVVHVKLQRAHTQKLNASEKLKASIEYL